MGSLYHVLYENLIKYYAHGVSGTGIYSRDSTKNTSGHAYYTKPGIYITINLW